MSSQQLQSSAFIPSGPTARPVSRTPATRAPATEMRKKSVSDLTKADLEGKNVLVRCDLNVPLHDVGNETLISDRTRIDASLPTIKYLMDNGAKVILMSHLGRPKGHDDTHLSLMPVAHYLASVFDPAPIKFVTDCMEPGKDYFLNTQMENGEIMLLENLRFYKEEEQNAPKFAERLSEHADLFVNDAFGTAHRAHASTVGVTDYLAPCVSGFLLQKELDYLDGAIADPKRPFAAIIGGSKVSSKIGVIESLMDKVDKIVIGGGMVFTFLKARGLNVGSSLVEEDQLELATKLEKLAAKKKVEFILPTDVVIADKFAADAATKVVGIDAIPDGWMGLDNGPKSTKMIQDKLKGCKTVIWNGPMGVFEFEAFAEGTFAVAKTLAGLTKKGCTTIVGGGDSVAAVEKAGLADKMSHISTGGGASLELLEGKVLPGVAALDDA